jgi:hypothetical protein
LAIDINSNPSVANTVTGRATNIREPFVVSIGVITNIGEHLVMIGTVGHRVVRLLDIQASLEVQLVSLRLEVNLHKLLTDH